MLRLRANDVIARACIGMIPVLTYAGGALSVVKATHGAPALARGLAWGAALPLLVLAGAVLHAALRHKPPTAGALALDRHHGLDDRVTSALEFEQIAERSRTPLMQAAIADALSVAATLSPARAVPIRAPRDLAVAAVLLVGVVGIALFEVPVVRVVPAPPPRHVDALALGADDVDLLRRMADELSRTTTDPATQAGARRFNQIVEDLAERRLDRREVFRRLDELERGLTDPVGLDGAAIDEALDGVAKELDKSALSKPVAEALAERRLADAERAMKELAKKVETAKKTVDRDKLEALRRSLERAEKTVHEKSAKAEAARAELEERRKRLLQKKQKEGLSQAEKEELNRTERQLAHLDRQRAQENAGQQGLSGLDKDLAKAAQDLMKDLGQGSQDLEHAAEDIRRTGEQRLSEEQKKDMLRRIEELRQILRQEGQAGRDRVKRMMAFGQKAHGQNGQGQGPGQGKGSNGPGQGKDGKGRGELVFGRGSPGPGSALVMAPGGAPAPGSGSASEAPGGGSGTSGSEWGTGHDPNLRGDVTNLKGQTENVTAAAVDTGQGAAASEVIYGAAERGFVGHGYKKVYTDYRNVAEETLEKDEIPPGYRFYVRRYFQLIRPRD